jgi:hypothetical protein
MRMLTEDQTKFNDRFDEFIYCDPMTWPTAIEELKERNARLAQIVAELLIKNQRLRYALEPLAKLQEIDTGVEASRNSA